MTQVPSEILTGVGGMLVTIIGGAVAHFTKTIPITFGEKKMDYITKTDLETNCTLRQESLDKKLERIFEAIKESAEKIDKLHNTVIQHRIELGERIARVEETR